MLVVNMILLPSTLEEQLRDSRESRVFFVVAKRFFQKIKNRYNLMIWVAQTRSQGAPTKKFHTRVVIMKHLLVNMVRFL